MLWDHVAEQWKQIVILVQIACVQELDQEDWAFDGSKGLETGMEGSEEEEMKGQDGNGHVEKIDKGKGKERVEDGNESGRKHGNKGGDGNGRADGETLQ